MAEVIRISERATNPDGSFVVRVDYQDGTEHDVTVTDPASDNDEQLFARYFEQHLRYPFLDLDRRAEAVAGLRKYGETLFGQIFGDKPGRRYLDFRGSTKPEISTGRRWVNIRKHLTSEAHRKP